MTSKEVRTNPFVSIMPRFKGDEPEYIIRDFLRNRSYEIPNYTLLELLGDASKWIECEELKAIAREKYGLSDDVADSVVRMLKDKDLLVPADSEVFELEQERKRWHESGWGGAFDYYVCIRDYPYYDDNDPTSILERVAQRAERYDDLPSLYKEYEGVPQIELEDVGTPTFGSVANVLGESGAKTGRNGQNTAIDSETLSEVLFYTFGEIGRQSLDGVGEFLLKTSPSGGSRHPTEAYVISFDVDGIEKGVYHYSVKNHSLERLGETNGIAGALSQRQSSAESMPSFVVIFTSVLARDMWKYRDPRAYRIPNHDVGHVMETFRLVCNASELAVTFERRFDKQELAAQLGLDRLGEPILACASVE